MLNIIPSSLELGGVWRPGSSHDDLNFAPGMGRIIVVGVIRANHIWVGPKTQIHTFDHIECKTFRSECDVTLHSLAATDWVEVNGRLGTFSCKASRIQAEGAITAAKNLEAVYHIGTLASINVGGHIICKNGPIMAVDGINCGNTIQAGGEITTNNALCAGACSWRRSRNNDLIISKSINAGAVIGRTEQTQH